MNNNNPNNDNTEEAKRRRKNEAQKVQRARNKRDYDYVENNPGGSFTKEQRDNHARHVKFLNGNRRYNKKRKQKADNDPREKSRQREKSRTYSLNYRDRKKLRLSTENSGIDISPSSNNQIESTESTVQHNHEFDTELVIPQPNDSSITESTIVETRNNLFTSITTPIQTALINNHAINMSTYDINRTELVIPQPNESSITDSTIVETRNNVFTSITTPIQAALINNNATDISTNNINVTCSSSRAMLQSSPTKSPRNNTIDESVENTTSGFITEEPMTQFDYNDLNQREIKMIRCLENDLFSWGFPEKDRLISDILQSALQIIKNPNVASIKEQRPVTLKKKFVDSFKMMLDKEVGSAKDSYTIVVDEIENLAKKKRKIVYGRPYYLDNVSNGNETIRTLKDIFDDPSYQKYLDPRKRFSIHTQSKNENLLQSFTQDDNCLDGYIFELMVAQFAQDQNVLCRSCKNPTLRWNGGSGYPWMDLVCTNCKSTYEIKSKKSLDSVSENLRKGKIEGGCFASFINLRSYYSTQEDARQYVIVVSRTPSEGSYPSYNSVCGKIHNVYPIINTKSFGDMDMLRFKSKIIVKRCNAFAFINKDLYSPGRNRSFAEIAKLHLRNSHGLM